MADAAHATAVHGEHADDHAGHVVSNWLLAGVLFVLLILTWLTYALAGVKLGNANIIVAIVIATIKAGIVAMFFMHLRWDKPFNAVILVASLLFVALFISLAMMDTNEYHPTIQVVTELPGMKK